MRSLPTQPPGPPFPAAGPEAAFRSWCREGILPGGTYLLLPEEGVPVSFCGGLFSRTLSPAWSVCPSGTFWARVFCSPQAALSFQLL